MKLVSIDDTGIYVYEYTKKDNMNEITENLRKNNIHYYITEKHNTLTIIK